MAGTIAPDQILHDMADLWVSLGKQGDNEAGVLRACSMTLLVAAEESDDAQSIGETLAALMPEHPSRAIVIRFRNEAERSLSARVFAQCWMPFGHRQQICCEQIEITASDESLPDLAAVVLPLTVPDLPVILWCRSPRLFRMSMFPELSDIAHKLVIDSAAFGDPPGILKEMNNRVSRGQLLADLSWTRLTRWREMIAQIFENRAQLANLVRVTEVRISYPSQVTPVLGYYLAAWLREGLEKADSRPRLSFESAVTDPGRSLNRVELLGSDGQVIASIALVEGHAAEVRTAKLASRAVLPPPTDYGLMREELSIPGRDPVFEKTLAAAVSLAVS